MSLVPYDIEARRKSKMHSEERILSLKVIDGKKPLSSTGNVDARLFGGENNLRAVYDDRFGMWGLKYDLGAIPGGLDQKFTDFDKLLQYVRSYFKTRNVEVTEVIDT